MRVIKSKSNEDAYGEIHYMNARLKSLAQLQNYPDSIDDLRARAIAKTISVASQRYIEEIKEAKYLPLEQTFSTKYLPLGKTKFGDRVKIPDRLQKIMDDARKWTLTYSGLMKSLNLELPEDDMG